MNDTDMPDGDRPDEGQPSEGQPRAPQRPADDPDQQETRDDEPNEFDEPESPTLSPARTEQQLRLPLKTRRSLNQAFEAIGGSAGLQRLQAQVRESLAEALRPTLQLDSIIGQFRRDFVLPFTQSPQWRETMRDLARVGKTIERYYPPNWVDADVSLSDFDRVLTVAREDGVPLVWVPRAAVVDELLQAPDSAKRRQVLWDHASDIVADCTAVAEAVSHERLLEYRSRLLEAIAALRADVPSAGQALAAVVVTALLQWVYGHQHLKDVRTSPMRANDSEGQVLRTVKLAVLIEASVPAVQGNRDKVTDQDWPDRFNRHVTVHRVADRAFTLPNALTALMLATGLLAEAEQLLEDGRLELR